MFDELWPGGPRFCRSDRAFPLGTDSVLLADFTNSTHAKRALDIGCGAGVLTILLAQKASGAEVHGIELQPDSSSVCRENMTANHLNPAWIRTGDIRAHRTIYEAGSFDLVVSNPPYFAAGSGHPAPDDLRAIARDERNCTMEDLCQAAGYLLKWGGLFSLVHRPERLSELLCCLTKYGMEPKRLRMVQHKARSAPNLVLAEAKRGGKPGLSIEPPLILSDSDGTDTEEVQRIYHRGKYL